MYLVDLGLRRGRSRRSGGREAESRARGELDSTVESSRSARHFGQRQTCRGNFIHLSSSDKQIPVAVRLDDLIILHVELSIVVLRDMGLDSFYNSIALYMTHKSAYRRLVLGPLSSTRRSISSTTFRPARMKAGRQILAF
jgi:hypothetical protein